MTAEAGQQHQVDDSTGSRKIRLVEFSPKNVWRVGWVVIALVACALLLNFFREDGGSVVFTVLMSWFAAIAMEPAVSRLAKHMRRGFATIIVMVGFLLATAIFFFAFGALIVDQISQVIVEIPNIATSLIEWVNQSFGTSLSIEEIQKSANLDADGAKELAQNLGSNVLGILGSILGTFFGLFVFGMFTFYLSADQPRLRRWVAGLFPEQVQRVLVTAWDTMAQKTGSYIGARVVLAAINSATTGIVFFIIGMPYWLALALWTGIVAQFVPTIGTYIAIVLPVLVGLISGEPWIGVVALLWALLYQQVENLTIEPKISAKAVNVHPAVAFGAVLLGAALFGVAGAFLAIPVVAMILAMLNIYRTRYDLIQEVHNQELVESNQPS